MCLAVSIEKYEKIFGSPFQFTTYTWTRRHARNTCVCDHWTQWNGNHGSFCPRNSTISTTTVVADTMSAEKAIRTMGETVQNYSAKLRSNRWFRMNFHVFSLLCFSFFLWHSSWCFWSSVLFSSAEFYGNNSFIHSFF